VTDRPIMFSAPMVRALLAGRKTQTRRIIDFAGVDKVIDFVRVAFDKDTGAPIYEMKDGSGQHVYRPTGKHFLTPHWSPRFAVGDRLWVREAHYLTDDGNDDYVVYVADGNDATGEHLHEVAALEKLCPSVDWSKHKRQRPSIHMPRWASRLTLTVTEIRVHRLQEISEADAVAEGAPLDPSHHDGTQDGSNPHMVAVNAWTRISPVAWYHRLWDDLNAKRGYGWDTNPWVTVITFTVEPHNIDEVRP
jgi:hypothetical protein